MARKRTTNKKKLRRQARAQASQATKPGDRSPVCFSLMAKPIGPACNLRCHYCFYLEKEALLDHGDHRMSDEVLEAYVRKYIESQPPGQPIAFHWQGGEPTLMGLDFYRKAIELQRRYADGKQFTNALQTNGPARKY